MAYSLKSGESVREGIIRIGIDQLDRAIRELTDEHLSLPEQVHQARKRFKKIRGLLRLVRPAMEDTYSRENAWFRDAGRELATVRDAEVAVKTVAKLEERFRDQIGSATLTHVKIRLQHQRNEISPAADDLLQQAAHLAHRLTNARGRVSEWTLSAEGFDAIGPGLKKTYKRARKCLGKALKNATPAALHELRKRIKYHGYHLRLLRRVWPSLMKGFRRAAKQVARLLGDDHDLVVLEEAVCRAPQLNADQHGVEVLKALIAQHQQRLRGEAFAVARRLLAEKPKRFRDRLGAYWETWQAGTQGITNAPADPA